MSREFHSCPRELSIASAPSIRQSHPLSSSQMAVSLEQALYPDLPLYNIGGYGEISGVRGPHRSLKQRNHECDSADRRKNERSAGRVRFCMDGRNHLWLARRTAEAGFAGVERFRGIPGTVGGGVYMNAGAHGALSGQTRDRHQAAHALRDLIDARTRRVRAGLPEARDAAVDQARVDRA